MKWRIPYILGKSDVPKKKKKQERGKSKEKH